MICLSAPKVRSQFFEIVKGFGMLPDKEIADFALRVPRCIACQVCFNITAKMQSGYRRALLATDDCILARITLLSSVRSGVAGKPSVKAGLKYDRTF